jgi:hypothetical protein
MGIKLGATNISNIFLGAIPITNVYLGAELLSIGETTPNIPPTTPVTWIQGKNIDIAPDGTITKISGGNAWNAGARSQEQTVGTTNFKIEYVVPSIDVQISFGVEEAGDDPMYGEREVNYSWEINPNGLTEININTENVYTGSYVVGDVFQVEIDKRNLLFKKNNEIVFRIDEHGDWPMVAIFSMFYQGHTFKPNFYIS